ncbi:MAG: NADH-quinone oxidoreductase subunit M [Chloroflexi bacterium]|nr:NADH-quinone oxidoreductase subunit M [Chloroflexota bacterium]
MFEGWLSIIVFLPAAAALVIALFLRDDARVRWFAIGATVLNLVLIVITYIGFDRAAGGVQMIDRYEDWIPVEGLRAEYLLGIDGLSAPMLLLTGLLSAVAAFASWRITHRVREYFIWLLVLQTAVLGVFTALDFLLFFIFWEIELIPMFMLISIWGSGRSQYSAMKFVIFTLAGSAFMLIGILALFLSTGVDTFAMVSIPSEGIIGIPEKVAGSDLLIPAGVIWFLLFSAFAVKMPLWPLHSWLPDAHTDAPTAVSIMLAGVLLKMGGYGLLRVSVGMFQETKNFQVQDVAWLLAVLAVISIIYGAIVTIRQTDLKRLIAFSSVSHMGFVVLGVSSIVGVGGKVTEAGLNGAALQMVTHGTITGLLFLTVGLVYDRAHTRYIPDLGGLAVRLPLITVAMVIAALAALGLPGLSGFVAEIMVFLGTYEVWKWLTAIGAFGVVLAAGYILWMVQRTFFGPRNERFDDLEDANFLDMIPVVALVISIVAIGVYPKIITDVFKIGISELVRI